MANKKEMLERGLPKWPAFVVVGKPVTEEQAKEIIVRTDHLDFCINDREWERILNQEIYGVYADFHDLNEKLASKNGMDANKGMDVWDLKDKLRRRYNPISLGYLHNHRIASSWIGGPQGWCDWNGKIGCSNYNIGKWPSVEVVYEEWKNIAKAFPFLELKCQLMGEEAGEVEEPNPIIQFNIKDGKVKLHDPKQILDYPVFAAGDSFAQLFTNPYRERGNSEEVVIDALRFVEEKYKEQEVS